MNTTRQRLFVASFVGIGLAGYVNYLVGHNSPSASLTAGSNTAPSLMALAPPQQEQSLRKMERLHIWRSVRPNLFSPPASNEPLPLPLLFSARTNTFYEPLASLLPAPPLADPLADYAYTGTVGMEGTLSALIEHRTSKQGWYVREGDPWQNYRIVSVSMQDVTVLIAGKTHILSKSTVINLVPLLADADSGATSLGENSLTQIAQAETQKKGGMTDADVPLSVDEIAHVKDEVFEGHLSAEEAERIFQEKGFRAVNSTDVFILEALAKIRP